MSTRKKLDAKFPFFSNDPAYVIPITLSLAAATIISLACLLSRNRKKPLTIMVLLISLSNIIFDASKLLSLAIEAKTQFTCQIYEAVSLFGFLSSITFAACFGHALFMVLKSKDIRILSKMVKYYFYMGTIYPFVNAVASMYFNSVYYLQYASECVYQIDRNTQNWPRHVFWHVPLAIAVLLSLLWYRASFLQAQNLRIANTEKQSLTLLVYPGILVVCWAPVCITEVIAELDPYTHYNSMKWFKMLAYSMGLLNAIAYGEEVVRLVRQICFKPTKNTINISEQGNKSEYLISNTTKTRIDFYDDSEISQTGSYSVNRSQTAPVKFSSLESR